jgi:MOSC domain-containing protein YiiM
VSCKAEHGVEKTNRDSIQLLEGLGVEGDSHLGKKVQHLSRAQRDPDLPNLRQVHLIQAELHEELARAGIDVTPGAMGENVTTKGIDLLGLPVGARLQLGDQAVVEVTGLRNPCLQLEGIAKGLLGATVERNDDGGLVRKAGIMGVVIAGGEVRPGDAIRVDLPPTPHRALEAV